MNHIFDIFIVGGLFCSLLTSLVLFFSARHQGGTNRLLAVVLFSLAWFVFQYVLVLEGWARQVPAIIRTAYPFSFLALPLAYLYVRSWLSGDARLRKSDWVHFIPAAIGLADLSAYFIGGTATQQNLFHWLTGNGGNLFSARISLVPVLSNFIFLPAQALIYLVLLWGRLLPYLWSGISKAFSPRQGLATWLQVFIVVLTLIYSDIALEVFTPGIGPKETTFFISFCLLILSTCLFFRPDILYGTFSRCAVPEKEDAYHFFPQVAAPVPAMVVEQPVSLKISQPEVLKEETDLESGSVPEAETASERTILVSPGQVAFYANELKSYLIQSEIYRKQGISINELAVALQIPARQLSYVINQHYHQRFNDLINSYRVDYIVDRLQKDEWRALTLEGLATEAGFSSRSTFFSAFKKATSLNPTQFLQEMAKMAG